MEANDLEKMRTDKDLKTNGEDMKIIHTFDNEHNEKTVLFHDKNNLFFVKFCDGKIEFEQGTFENGNFIFEGCKTCIASFVKCCEKSDECSETVKSIQNINEQIFATFEPRYVFKMFDREPNSLFSRLIKI